MNTRSAPHMLPLPRLMRRDACFVASIFFLPRHGRLMSFSPPLRFDADFHASSLYFITTAAFA